MQQSRTDQLLGRERTTIDLPFVKKTATTENARLRKKCRTLTTFGTKTKALGVLVFKAKQDDPLRPKEPSLLANHEQRPCVSCDLQIETSWNHKLGLVGPARRNSSNAKHVSC